MCLDLLSELEDESKKSRQPINVRIVLELQSMFQKQLQLELWKLRKWRKHCEYKLQTLEEKK